MQREFHRAHIEHGSERPLPAYQILCSKCGATERIVTNTWGGAMAPEKLASRFRSKGWTVGRKETHDLCPTCTAKRRGPKEMKIRMEKQALRVVSNNPKEETVSNIAVIVEPPRVMSKEDRRLVFAKIEEHYLDKAYEEGWNDKRVASDLGVPVAWVTTMRDENFGPEGLNAEQQILVDEARKLIAKLELEANILNGHINEGSKVRDLLLDRAKEMTDKLGKIIGGMK